jgi:hypothetical protein
MSKYLLSLSFFFCLLSSALGGIIQVPQDQPGIQAGINAAFPGDTVLVADSTYYENIDFKGKVITVTSYFLIDGDTTHIDSTVINGSQPSDPDKGSVVSFVSEEDTTSVLCGFTITKGTGTNFPYVCKIGGGILCYNSGARILNNKIINNSVNSPDVDVFGGGLSAITEGENEAYVILKDNHIKQNTITANSGHAFGGGAALYCDGMLENNQISFNSVVQNATDKQGGSGGIDINCLNLIMEHNKIAHNSVFSNSDQEYATVLAGGCMIQRSQGRFSRNEVSHNEIWIKTGKNAVGAGMEILQVANSFIIEGNIIKGNAITHGTGWGGAAGFGFCSPCMINNIVAGNSATSGGALYFALNSDVQLINNTIINNQASYGGAIYVTESNPVLMNSIIWNNQASTYAAIHIESGTVQAAYCDIQGGWTGTGNINLNPRLNADSLLNDSPCIGTGFHSFDFGGGMICHYPVIDINGRSRPYPSGTKPDMGALESLLDTALVGIDLMPIATVPQEYSLSQNYPNPFNPSTTIEFALPKSAFVTLKVYNLLGEEVATLVAEQRSAGIHRLNWDARGLATGVYLYRLKAGDPSNNSGQDFVQTKKLILLR